MRLPPHFNLPFYLFISSSSFAFSLTFMMSIDQEQLGYSAN